MVLRVCVCVCKPSLGWVNGSSVGRRWSPARRSSRTKQAEQWRLRRPTIEPLSPFSATPAPRRGHRHSEPLTNLHQLEALWPFSVLRGLRRRHGPPLLLHPDGTKARAVAPTFAAGLTEKERGKKNLDVRIRQPNGVLVLQLLGKSIPHLPPLQHL